MMQVGFYTVFRKDPQHYECARILVDSIRRQMPGVPIVQFSDETSPEVFGIMEMRRKPHGRMLELRLEHYADLTGDWLLLDTDTLVCQDVREVFDAAPFDVALADRNWPHIPPTPDLTKAMPFNTGVVFSRCPPFWQTALAIWRAFPETLQNDWLSEQRAVAAAAASGQFRILVLPGARFNYPPATADDPLTEVAIAHFKGQRKAWLRARGVPKPPVTVTESVATLVPVPGPIVGPVLVPRSPVVVKEPIQVTIGYDPRQPIAFHVAAHSVQTRASGPVSITRLQLNQLPIASTRRGLTEFTYSRFLTPFLSQFHGWSVFLDADTLCLGDVAELVALARQNPPAPVHVIQGPQRFEWSSVMVFDNARCQILTPTMVNDPANKLLDLAWSEAIGNLPAEWNHLVGYAVPRDDAKLVHFTQGVPTWPETQACEYSKAWQDERKALLHTVSFVELMGHSVHVQHMPQLQAR